MEERRQDRRPANGGWYNLLRLPDDVTVTQVVRNSSWSPRPR
jgi:hypothetical protein